MAVERRESGAGARGRGPGIAVGTPGAARCARGQCAGSTLQTERNPAMIKRLLTVLLAVLSLAVMAAPAWADEYTDTINVFRKAVESKGFFDKAYGYAVFPSVGKGGVGVGGAYGKG